MVSNVKTVLDSNPYTGARPVRTMLWLRVAWAMALMLLSPIASQAQDSDLFRTQVPPNVVLMVDNSGSMNHVVWHPAYDPEVTNSCACFSGATVYVRGGYGWSGCGSGDHYIPPGTYSACGNTREIFIDPIVSADGNRTRWSSHYLNWYFSDAADDYAADIAATQNGTRSGCLTDPSGPNLPPTYDRYRRTRTAAAKEVLREVVCQVNAEGDVRFGLAKFYKSGDPKGVGSLFPFRTTRQRMPARSTGSLRISRASPGLRSQKVSTTFIAISKAVPTRRWVRTPLLNFLPITSRRMGVPRQTLR